MTISVLVDRIARWCGIQKFKRTYSIPALGADDHDDRHGPFPANLPSVGVQRAIQTLKRRSVVPVSQVHGTAAHEQLLSKAKYVSVETREVEMDDMSSCNTNDDGFLGLRRGDGSMDGDISYESVRPGAARYYDPVQTKP